MPKISRKASTTLSFLFAILFLLVLALMAVALPFLAAKTVPNPETVSLFGLRGRLLTMIAGYIGIAIGIYADITLLFLLHSVRRERVFTHYCVALLRSLSWCCMGEALVFLTLGALYIVALFISFIALLVGLCMRVVKNVFEQAVAMKEENDLTV